MLNTLYKFILHLVMIPLLALTLGACSSSEKSPTLNSDLMARDSRLSLAYGRVQALNRVYLQALQHFNASQGSIPDARKHEFEACVARYRSETLEPLTRWWINRAYILASNRGAEVRQNGEWIFISSLSPVKFFEMFEVDFASQLSRLPAEEDRLNNLLFPVNVSSDRIAQ